MLISVLFPTFQRRHKALTCAAALAAQTLPRDRYEVLIGLDGPDDETRTLLESLGRRAPGFNLRVVEFPRDGYMAVRNGLLREARGELLVSLNDDVRPDPNFLEAHARGHNDFRSRTGRNAIIVGSSPYLVRDPETALDRLVQRTSMVFFYDVMDREHAAMAHTGPNGRDKDWGFRHVFGLNFSTPLAAVRDVGGFFEARMGYGYDDIELGYRLTSRLHMPVLYRPAARADHDHFYEPADILTRECRLGEAAWAVAAANPDFALATFGRDIRSDAEIEYSRAFVSRERAAAERLRASFDQLGKLPASIFDGPHSAALMELISQQHLLLKRWTWRTGLLAAAAREQGRDFTPEPKPESAAATQGSSASA